MRLVHRDLDPRAKLTFVIAIAGLAVVLHRLEALLGLAVVLGGVVAAGRGFGFREWLGTLAPFKVIVPLIIVLNAVFYGGGRVLWEVSVFGIPVTLSAGGIETSAIIATRLLVVAAAASWFAATTDPEEFEAALASLGIPWSFAFLCSLTLRLVPTMRDRFRVVEEAQRSRGLTWSGGPLRQARARIPMLIPFLVSVIRYGYELADALVVRDFGTTAHRTSLVHLDHDPADYGLYAAAVLTVGVFLMVFG